MSFSDFKKIASEIDYDNGYGVAQIALDLVVVAACWWLERREYDGAEWWEFATVPLMSAKPIENFIFMHRVRDTGTIESINNHKED
jgi:hypothetical protein